MSASACPALETTLARAAGRARRRRVSAGLLVALGLSGVTAFALEAVRAVRDSVGEPPFGHAFAFGAGVAVFAAGILIAAWGAWGGVDEERLAREIDARLGLPDVAATTLALARGRATSPLAPFVFAQAGPVLTAAAPRIDLAFAGTSVARAVARRLAWLTVLAWIAALLLLVIDLLHWFDFGFGLLGRGPDRDTGIVAQTDPSAERKVPAERGGAEGGDAPREAPGPGEEPPPPDAPPRDPPKPKDAGEPDVKAKVKPSRETFREQDQVLVVVSARPTRELPADLPLSVTFELDGKDAPGGVELRLGPSAPLGAGEIRDLRRIPEFAGRLAAGEHTVRAKLTDAAGNTYASEPAKFRVEGDPGGSGGGGAEKPQPKPQPDPKQQPKPEPPPPSQPPPPPPPAAPGERPAPRPPEGGEPPPPPKVPVAFDPKTVLPLFREGEEVEKKGPTVVLVPGGGPDGAKPQRAALEEALPDAVKRAEAQVERGGVREADRELVRRYFEELRRELR